MKYNHWIIAYDICDEKRLRKVVKICERYAVRIQKSLFEIDFSQTKQPEKILEKFRKELFQFVEDSDSVLFIPICEKDFAKIEKRGFFEESKINRNSFALL